MPDRAISVPQATQIAQATKRQLTELNGRLDELESGSRGGLSSTQKQTLMDVINALGGAFTTPDAQDLIDAFNSAWNVTVTGISLNKSTLSFSALTSETLRATLSPSDATGTVTWVSSNTSVVTVDSNGTVVVVGNGTATITASCGGYSATCAVTVSGIRTTYTVTYNLTGCESSNPQTRAEEDSAFTTNITPVVGYLLPFTAYTVTMGGTDITASAWSNGAVSIADVTGAIVISATATVDTRELVANWDFTKSLTDSVGSYEMELINSNSGSSLPTRDNTGLHFTAAEQVARCSTVTLNRLGYEYELDIASAEFAGDNSKHKRLLLSGGSNAVMVFRNAGALQMYSGAWLPYTAEDGKTIPTSTNDLSGKTVGVKIGSEKNVYLYIDGVLIGQRQNWPPSGQTWEGIAIGGTASGTQNDGNQIHNMTVTGLRVYREATT